jgi:mRNA interferase MazF
MKFTMPFDFGDVVLVPFPFTNQMTSKQRPAVIVSHHAYARARPDVVVMAITSQVRAPLGFADTLLTDWQEANLLKPSVVKPVFATLEQGLLIKQLGQLSVTDQETLRLSIKQAIG